MTDEDCVQFLQKALPQLRMRWQGFRKVRRQVCKRIDRRMRTLGMSDVAAYRSFLEKSRDEWNVLDSYCRITISRFYRDRELFRALEHDVLPRLCEAASARGEGILRCWSAGCASGEEPYTLAILWNYGTGIRFPSIKISIIATDADPDMIERAKEGCYAHGSLREMPLDRKTEAFIRGSGRFCIKPAERGRVTFLEQDLRTAEPTGMFHLILCRNLAFTYFDQEVQKNVLDRLHYKLYGQGVLVTGVHESLPPAAQGFAPWPRCPGAYRKISRG